MSRSLRRLVGILCAAVIVAHSCNKVEYNPASYKHKEYVTHYSHNDTLLQLSTMYLYDYRTGNTGVQTLIINSTNKHIKRARAICVGICGYEEDSKVIHSLNYEIVHPTVGGLNSHDSVIVTIPLYINHDSIKHIEYIIPEVEIEK